MLTTFEPMAKSRTDEEDPRKRVSVGAKVSPSMAAELAKFGRHLRQRNLTTHGTGGVSNAIDAILEMAKYLKWFDREDDFADELLAFRIDPDRVDKKKG